MILNPKLAWAGITATMLAWGCFQGMEMVPDQSWEETTLLVIGYALIPLALYLLYRSTRQTRT